MPNHITNRLTIVSDDVNRIKEIFEAIKGDKEGVFIDFNKINPIPTLLEDTVSPMRICTQEEYDAQEARIAKGELTENEKNWGIGRRLTQELVNKALKDYGATDWYDWQRSNWGTKWNAYSQVQVDDTTIEFDTAWSTPFPIFEKISTMFPDVQISVKYADEDFGYNVGEFTLCNGEEIELNQPEGGSFEAYEMAMDVKNDDEYYLHECIIDNVNDEEEISDFTENLIQIAHNKGVLDNDYPVLVLERLKDLALADEQFERVTEIDALLKASSDTE